MENGDDADDGGDELMSPTSEADSDSDSDDDSQEHDMPSPGNKRDDCPYDPERPETCQTASGRLLTGCSQTHLLIALPQNLQPQNLQHLLQTLYLKRKGCSSFGKSL